MGPVKANSTGQANSATKHATPSQAYSGDIATTKATAPTTSTAGTAFLAGTGGTSAQATVIHTKIPANGRSTATTKEATTLAGGASPTVPATDGTTDNIELQTATVCSEDATPSIPETIRSHHLESLIAVGTALGGVIIVFSVVLIILVGKGRKGSTEISPKPTIYPLFSNPSYVTTGKARATQVEAVYETIPGYRTIKEVKKPTSTFSACKDVSINLEKRPNKANETEQKTSPQDYVNVE